MRTLQIYEQSVLGATLDKGSQKNRVQVTGKKCESGPIDRKLAFDKLGH